VQAAKSEFDLHPKSDLAGGIIETYPEQYLPMSLDDFFAMLLFEQGIERRICPAGFIILMNAG
jgi:hypothetical protein